MASCSFTGAAGVALVNDTEGQVTASETAELLDSYQASTPSGALLFPVVTTAGGSAGLIAIANTSAAASGSCGLTFHGKNAPSPLSTESIAPGSVYTAALQGVAPGFEGYVIAACGFPGARGWAATSDGGGRAEVLGGQRSLAPGSLLFTSVSNRDGMDTEIAITNTSQDPLGTSQAPGTCTISYFGGTADGRSVPAPSTSATIEPGGQLRFWISAGNAAQGIAAAPGFRGYVIGDCTFPQARGAATTRVRRAAASAGGPAAGRTIEAIATNPRRSGVPVYADSAPLRLPRAAAASSTELRFVPVTPCRVADTRNANGPFGGPQMTTGSTRDFTIPNGACAIPATAQAYSVNVTVVPAGKLGYLTAWPSGQPKPLASTLNSLDGRIKSNAAIVPAGTNGAISIFVSDTTHVVIDINGYFVAATDPAGLSFYPVTPCRVADTRKATGPLGGPSLVGGQLRPFPILSAATCNIPSSAQAYSLNLAAVPKGALGYITAWPTGQSQPLVSSLNAPTGTVVANAAIVPAGAGGAINVFASNNTDLVIDINGYFAAAGPGGLSLYNMTPCRVLDTRQGAGAAFSGTLNVPVATSSCAPPAEAQTYVMGATVVPIASLGYLTLWAQGQTQPAVSTLNALDGAITSNLALVPTTNGRISAFASDATHLVLDIFGYFAPPAGSSGLIAVSNVNLGNNLQAQMGITLNPAPAGSVTLTISSDNPSVLLGSSDAPGATTLTATISAGTNSVSTYVKGLANSGTANITVSAQGYSNGTGVVTLYQSGFVISSPNGIGAAFTTFEGVSTDLTVFAARVDNSGVFAESQQTRGGATFNVPVSNTAPGSVSPTTLTFTGGTTQMTTTFSASPSSTGSGTVSVGPPSGFITPTAGASVGVTVQQSGFLVCDPGNPTPTVGKNLQTNTCARVTSGPLAGPITVTLHSNDATRLKFSLLPTDTPAGDLQVTIAKNQVTSPDFYIHAFDSTGSVTYTESGPGYGSATITVNLAPTGFVIQTPTGFDGDFTVSLGTVNPTLNIYAAALNGSGAVIAMQAAAGGVSIPVTVTSSQTSVGTIVTSPITITGGSFFASTNFHAAAVGTTAVTASSTNYTSASVNVTVQNPTIVVTGGITIGKFLQEPGQVILPVAPSGSLQVTLQSNDSLLRFSTDPTKAGTTTLVLNFTSGQTIGNYYIQAAGSSGTSTYTASATGYSSGNGSIALAPSGVVIVGPGACQLASCTVSASGGAQPMTIFTVKLDPSGLPVAPAETLAGGASLTVTLNNTNNAAGTVPASLTIAPNTSSATGNFTPGSAGATTVSVTQPAGYSTPASNTAVAITVQ